LGKEDLLLQDIADPSAPLFGQGLTVEKDTAAIYIPLATEAVQQSGLPTARRTHDGQDLAGTAPKWARKVRGFC